MSDLTGEQFVREFERSVVRRLSEERRKASNNEPMKFTKSGIQGRQAAVVAQAVSFPTRTTAKRVEVGKGGCEIGKWCNFSHLETGLTRLFPHKSTQVVDFPHLTHVSIFWEERFHHRDTEAQSQGKLRTKVGRLK